MELLEIQNKIGEILTSVRYKRDEIESPQYLEYALYLYQTSRYGPKKIKEVIRYLMQLSKLETLEANNTITKKLDHKIDQDKEMINYIKIYIQQQANIQMQTYIDPFYADTFYKTYHFLNENLGNAAVDFQVKCLFGIIQKNEESKNHIIDDIINEALCAKVRLFCILQMSQNIKTLSSLAEQLERLQTAIEENDYQKMKEETLYANARFEQTTRTSYQKVIQI